MNAGFDSLRTQLIAMFAIKGQPNDVSNLLTTFVVMYIIEAVMKYLPTLAQKIETYVERYIQTKLKETTSGLKKEYSRTDIGEKKEYIITFKRNFKGSVTNTSQQQSSSGGNVSFEYEICDCILEKMTTVNDAGSLEYNRFFYVNHTRPFKLDKHVTVQIKKIELSADSELQYIEFECKSDTYNLHQLHSYIQDIVKESRIKKQNKLGSQLYYFNEHIKPLGKDTDGMIVYRNAPEMMAFQMTKFFTTKTIHTLFGPEIEAVRKRLHLFINNPEWYSQKGIPYTFGLLIHGEPGCGKTSLCKAIAGMTSRHIINLSLHQYSTKRQLHNLFFEERIQIEKPGGMNEFLILPIDKRVYIIEDIDCMTDIVLDRSIQQRNKPKELNYRDTVKHIEPQLLHSSDDQDEYETMQTNEVVQNVVSEVVDDKRKKMEENLDDKLTLSFLLNLLDGVLETPGRIIIMTTNYPEKLDKALVRPGRVDMNICFKKCTHMTIVHMLSHFYDRDISTFDTYIFADSKFTPAEVYQIMFNYIDNVEKACNELCA